MKWLKAGLLVAAACVFLHGSSARALETEPYVPLPNLTASPVVITGYSLAGAQLEYVQLFNNSDVPVNLAGWKAEYFVIGKTESVLSVPLSDWIAPLNYVIVGSGGDFSYMLADVNGEQARELRIVPPANSGFASGAVANITAGERQRNKSTTGKYTATSAFVLVDISEEKEYGGGYSSGSLFTLYGGGFYEFPAQSLLQFSEIVANPRKCSPLETLPECDDFVKLYNPTTQPIDLSLFRLRVGYQGQSATSSNTFILDGVIQPGRYAVVTHDFDGRPISVTNSGGFVWLEDMYGVRRYDATVLEYPDAGADSKKGWAWAYDVNSGVWKWTSQPTPNDAPSVFVLPPEKIKTAAVKSLVACKENQYRSEETNRCRNIARTASTLTPCKSGQERNPDTNRCRSILGASTSLKSCKPGQERNPDTNRCRNVTKSIPEAAFAVEPVAETGKEFLGWWALGGVGALAVGYGAWEWRREVWSGIRKVGSFFTSSK
jgi:hypothetical protein